MGKTIGRESRTARRVTAHPLSRLRRSLDVYEHTAADELIAAHSMSIGEPVTHDPDLGIRQELRPDAADDGAARRVDLLAKFRQWQRGLAGTDSLSIASAFLFRERSLSDIDAENRWRKGTAKPRLVVAVRYFAALRGNTPRGARGWKVTAR